MLVVMKSQTSSQIGYVGSKTRSLGQISENKLGHWSMLEKPFVRFRGNIFSQIIMKLGQNICLDEISDEYENGNVRSKPWSHLRKNLFMLYQIFGLILMKLGQSVCLKEVHDLKMGHVGSKTMPLGQIIEDPNQITKGL